MKRVPNPHDAFFQRSMSDLRVAKDFFEHYLPKNILSITDLDSLSLEKSSFVDEQFRSLMADILYSVKIKDRSGYLYLLLEHQKKPDKLMPYRLWRYMIRIMDDHLRKEGSDNILPIVVPIVFFAGEDKYPYSTSFFSLFGDQEDIARDILPDPFTLIDVTQIPDEEIKKLHWAGVMAFFQKHILERDFLPIIKKSLPLLKGLLKEGADDYLLATVNYIFHSEIDNPVKVAKLLSDELSPKLGAHAMSLAERLKQEGREEGREEGLEEGLEKGLEKGLEEGEIKAQRRIAREMLKQKADIAFVAKVTGLLLEEVKSLEKDLNK